MFSTISRHFKWEDYRIPVRDTAIGGNPGITQNRYNGLLLPPGGMNQLVEKIQLLHSKPSAVLEMGSNGRKNLKAANNPQLHHERTLEIHEQLI